MLIDWKADESVASKKTCQQAEQQSGPSSGFKNSNAKDQISDSEDSDDDLEDCMVKLTMRARTLFLIRKFFSSKKTEPGKS